MHATNNGEMRNRRVAVTEWLLWLAAVAIFARPGRITTRERESTSQTLLYVWHSHEDFRPIFFDQDGGVVAGSFRFVPPIAIGLKIAMQFKSLRERLKKINYLPKGCKLQATGYVSPLSSSDLAVYGLDFSPPRDKLFPWYMSPHLTSTSWRVNCSIYFCTTASRLPDWGRGLLKMRLVRSNDKLRSGNINPSRMTLVPRA